MKGQSPFTRPTAVQIPLTIEPQPDKCDFPAIIINSGDFIVGDEDGVVCVPEEDLEKVMKLAEDGRATDTKCMEAIRAGLGVEESFKKFRGK